jgi:processing peptidase subunit beta
LNYLGRRVPRSEVAKRLSHFDTGLLNRVITRWFWDREINIVAWGAIHHLMNFGHYNRPIRRSSMGWYGNMHYKIL